MNTAEASSPLGLAVFISGTGRTLKNILDRAHAGELDVRVKLVVASSRTARGLQFAEKASIPIRVVERKDYPTRQQYSRAMFAECTAHHVDLVVLAGFVKFLHVPDEFVNRVVNIHPALIPAFCGHGFYGHRVHEAALEYGVKLSGCTVHFVDNQYDHGPVILQKAVPVLDDDTADTLAARVFEAEREAFPQALQLIAEGRVSVEGRRVRIAGG